MPGATRRTYPARISSLWLGTSASAGSSRRVRRNNSDMRVITADNLTDPVLPPVASLQPAGSRLQFAGLHRLAGVLRGGDLACRETDAHRGATDQHGDRRDPQQRVRVAGI